MLPCFLTSLIPTLALLPPPADSAVQISPADSCKSQTCQQSPASTACSHTSQNPAITGPRKPLLTSLCSSLKRPPPTPFIHHCLCCPATTQSEKGSSTDSISAWFARVVIELTRASHWDLNSAEDAEARESFACLATPLWERECNCSALPQWFRRINRSITIHTSEELLSSFYCALGPLGDEYELTGATYYNSFILSHS